MAQYRIIGLIYSILFGYYYLLLVGVLKTSTHNLDDLGLRFY